jgi:hypothetical protein
MKKKRGSSHRRVAKNHSMIRGNTQGRNDRTSASADAHEDYVNCWGQAEAIKTEFQMVANSLARLGRQARKEEVINLMAWEIGDLRRAIAHAARKTKGGRSR